MFDLLSGYYNYYYIILILQGICVFHSMRRGTQSKWVWIIVFLPLVGCLAYIFTEIIQKRHINSAQGGIVSLVNPNGRIKDLENKFNFTGTFANRVALADAYLERGNYEKAIELYEPALTGIFQNSEGVIKSLIQAYYKVGRFEDAIAMAPKVLNTLDFSKTPANLCYALALEKVGNIEEAEKEFKKMNHRFSNYEQRCYYGDFLARIEKREEAAAVYQTIVNEGRHMQGREKRSARPWINKARQELGKLALVR